MSFPLSTLLGICLAAATAGFAAEAVPAPAVPGPRTVTLPRTVVTPALLDGLSRELRSQHPALRAAEARARAATHEAAGTRRFADPTARIGGIVFDERNMFARQEGDLSYGVEQKLPLLGKEKAARRRSDTEVTAAVTRFEARFELLRRDLARAVLASALAEESAQLGAEDLLWLDTTVAATEARYRSGGSSQFDLLRMQNERAKRATLLVNDERRRDAARALVNHALGRAPWTTLPAFALPAVAADLPLTERLVAQALRHAPDVRVLERERAAVEAVVEVTRRSQRPDVALGVAGRQFSGDGGFRNGALTLSLSLPWLNRANYQRDIARDQEKLRAVDEDQTDAAIAIQNEIHHLAIEVEAARREVLLYRDDVLPRSEAALAAAQAGWSGGRGMMNDVLEARRMLVEARLMQARATAEQWSRLSDLAYVCGVPGVPELQAAALGSAHDTKSPTH